MIRPIVWRRTEAALWGIGVGALLVAAALIVSSTQGDGKMTRLEPERPFYPAEAYHQDYAKKNAGHYERYKRGSGRAGFIDDVWGKIPEKTLIPKADTKDTKPSLPSKNELKQQLSPISYRVTQEKGTEPPFRNAYWNEHRDGIYVDIVTGEPLFSSTDKFDSGSGWPSFTRPLDDGDLVLVDDFEFGIQRTEVRSEKGHSHLGHVFDDGPPPRGQRYCINSAALRFIPMEELEATGYGEYKKLFTSR